MRGKPNRYGYPYYSHFWEDPEYINEELPKVLRIISWFRGTNKRLEAVSSYLEAGVLSVVDSI